MARLNEDAAPGDAPYVPPNTNVGATVRVPPSQWNDPSFRPPGGYAIGLGMSGMGYSPVKNSAGQVVRWVPALGSGLPEYIVGTAADAPIDTSRWAAQQQHINTYWEQSQPEDRAWLFTPQGQAVVMGALTGGAAGLGGLAAASTVGAGVGAGVGVGTDQFQGGNLESSLVTGASGAAAGYTGGQIGSALAPRPTPAPASTPAAMGPAETTASIQSQYAAAGQGALAPAVGLGATDQALLAAGLTLPAGTALNAAGELVSSTGQVIANAAGEVVDAAAAAAAGLTPQQIAALLTTAGGLATAFSDQYDAHDSTPEWYKGAALDVLDKAKTESERPYEAYTGEAVAPMSSNEQQAYDLAHEGALKYAGEQPDYLSEAAAYGRKGAEGFPGSAGLDQYMNPYLEGVLDPVTRDMRKQYELEQRGNADRAVTAGAFGGSRQGIREAESFDAFMKRMGDTTNQIRSDAWKTGTNLWSADRDANYRAGNQFGNFSSLYDTQRGNAMGALDRTGATARGIDQAGKTFDYNQFVEGRDWSGAQLGRYADTVASTKPGAVTPPKDKTGAILGALASGIGMWNGGP